MRVSRQRHPRMDPLMDMTRIRMEAWLDHPLALKRPIKDRQETDRGHSPLIYKMGYLS